MALDFWPLSVHASILRNLSIEQSVSYLVGSARWTCPLMKNEMMRILRLFGACALLGSTCLAAGTYGMRYEVSTDGINWTKDPLNPVVGLEPNKWDSYSIYYPSVYVSQLGDPMLWYQGESGEGNTKSLGVVLWDPNAVPTPLPTFANEPPTPTDEPPPTETPTPIPVRCAFEGVECVLLPEISNGNK